MLTLLPATQRLPGALQAHKAQERGVVLPSLVADGEPVHIGLGLASLAALAAGWATHAHVTPGSRSSWVHPSALRRLGAGRKGSTACAGHRQQAAASCCTQVPVAEPQALLAEVWALAAGDS